jgi:hypothetical protein
LQNKNTQKLQNKKRAVNLFTAFFRSEQNTKKAACGGSFSVMEQLLKRQFLFQFKHEINAHKQSYCEGNAPAPYLKTLPTCERRFYLFDYLYRVRNVDGVLNENRITNDFVFVQIPVAFHKNRIAFVFDKNRIVTKN